MKFAMFFMAEYMAMATMSALVTTLFLGGWDIPWYNEPPTFVGVSAFRAGVLHQSLIPAVCLLVDTLDSAAPEVRRADAHRLEPAMFELIIFFVFAAVAVILAIVVNLHRNRQGAGVSPAGPTAMS